MRQSSARGGSSRYLIEVGEDSKLGTHLWYSILELLTSPLLLCFLLSGHTPLTLNRQTNFNSDGVVSHTTCSSEATSSTPYLLLFLPLHLFILQSEGELLQRRAVEGVLGALELYYLVKYGPQLVQKRLPDR